MTKFLLVDADIASELWGATVSTGHLLEPVEIPAGEHAGSYVLPLSVRDHPDFVDQHALLSSLSEIELDPKATWPISEDREQPE